MVKSPSGPELLELVEQALTDANRPGFPVSQLVERAMRVAQQNGDYDKVAWLELASTSAILEAV